MAKYIPLEPLLAEIDRLMTPECGYSMNKLLDYINTLEVKEVDLDKEIKEVQRNYKTIEEYEGYPCTMYAGGIEWIAKHFFELGLKARKGE